MVGASQKITNIINKHGNTKNSLLNILKDTKNEFSYISEEAIKIISDKLDIPEAKIEGVITFYSFLGSSPEGKYIIRICRTISCNLIGRQEIIIKIEEETRTKLNTTSDDGLFTFRECNCLGMCDQGPAILVNNVLLSKITIDDIEPIITACKKGNFNKNYNQRYVSKIHSRGELYNFLESESVTFKDNLSLNSMEIIEQITASGLKGRGGAGFPTGQKWLKALETNSTEKYIICNADEGEPGTFKDRFILDNYTDRVIQGMIIGAKAIKATEGIIYLRAEYSYLIEKIEKAIAKYDFKITIHCGAGSYICGEETALIESLEGKRGEARNRPPYPANVGYLGKPTVVNNVETFVNVCFIMERGYSKFRAIGTAQSNGTKFFSISGDCPAPGIYEIPFGITIQELIQQLGAENIKSVQLGGASGKNISNSNFDKIIAFEAVPSGGSIILFNKDRNMLETAKNFMEFFVDESCGQCVPCREGTLKLLQGINQLLDGNGTHSYLDQMIKLGNSVMCSSKCGLGQVCANSFISIINNHRDEINSYIKE